LKNGGCETSRQREGQSSFKKSANGKKNDLAKKNCEKKAGGKAVAQKRKKDVKEKGEGNFVRNRAD